MSKERELLTVFLMWKTKQIDSTLIKCNEYITILVNVGNVEYIITPYDVFFTVSNGSNTLVIDGHNMVNE